MSEDFEFELDPAVEDKEYISECLKKTHEYRRQENEKMSKMSSQEVIEYMNKKREETIKWAEEMGFPTTDFFNNEGE